MLRTDARIVGKALTVVGFSFALALSGCGQHEPPGEVTEVAVPQAEVAARAAKQNEALKRLVTGDDKQILFGDLHVHTTFSADAFINSLPMLQGEGSHPPADACDYARFCSQLDFWSINDHSEALTPRHWRETKELMRECNAVAGDPENPDTVAFVGWEWTQVGATPDDHYGHKNVIFRDLGEDQLPTRPISALNDRLIGMMRRRPSLSQQLMFPLYDFANRQRYLDFGTFQAEANAVPLCERGVDTRELPAECHEAADEPKVLYEKLSQWGFDTIVIPHGNTWGFYSPAGTTWDKQLKAAQNDPQKQTLIEIHSGHGNSEEYRDWRAVEFGANGEMICPEPTDNYLPCCWQAGEIVRARCESPDSDDCEQRVAEARKNFLAAGTAGRQVLPGASVEEWLDCGQCRDCFIPAFNYRPGGSAQYALSLTNFDDPENPQRFRFGFISSSDNHTARPGTGYKEIDRRENTEAAGPDQHWFERLLGPTPTPAGEAREFDPLDTQRALTQAMQLVDFERQASFFMTGGLVAVHSAGRSREEIWDALKRREVYATSGDRILLWFDLVNHPNGTVPMGAEAKLDRAPRFRVRAVGAYEQKPGCPETSTNAMSPERLDHLCRGECYNPGDTRRKITRIEVVRIRPQAQPGEAVASLIEDSWKVLPCPGSEDGCAVEFEDPDFVQGGREAIYYVRAIQEPTMATNAGGLRCEYDAEGNCIKTNPCYGDFRTPYEDDCLWEIEERAWSSPIYLTPGA